MWQWDGVLVEGCEIVGARLVYFGVEIFKVGFFVLVLFLFGTGS